MKIEVFDVKYEDLDLPIVPSKGHLNRDVNPEDVPNASYEVWSCAGPYGTYTYLGTTANLF